MNYFPDKSYNFVSFTTFPTSLFSWEADLFIEVD